MKVMAINRHVGTPISGCLPVDMIPDSAIIRDRKPFFVPDFASDWYFIPTIAFRSHRLGKNIAAKFASRYYDACTLALRMIPADLLDTLKAEGKSAGIATAFDGALIHGDWIPVEAIGREMEITVGDIHVSVSMDDLLIDTVIEQLSRYFTLKIGDMIIPCLLPGKGEVKINSAVTGSINGNECINFRIK